MTNVTKNQNCPCTNCGCQPCFCIKQAHDCGCEKGCGCESECQSDCRCGCQAK